MIFETLIVGPLQVNCYILAAKEGSGAIIIDPGADVDKIKAVLARFQLDPALVINTHGHCDHIGGDDSFGAQVYVHKDDAALLRDAELNLSNFLMLDCSVTSPIHPVEEGRIIENGDIRLEVIHTPGHTPGGICLLMKSPDEKILFTGDTLFAQGVGRSDFPGASHARLIESIKKKLLVLPDDTRIYPGHGPASTLAAEKQGNPFLA